MKIFEKFALRKKKISTKLRIFFLKNQFFANFSRQIVFFYVKFAFRRFPAFIWYTYRPCRSKITNFQKLWYRKLKNFRGQSRLLRRHLTAKLCNLGWCSKTLHVDKDVSFHLRPFYEWFAWKLTIQEHENHRGRIPPPPRLLDWPNIPALLGLTAIWKLDFVLLAKQDYDQTQL